MLPVISVSIPPAIGARPPMELRAGPIRLRLADGELRYLKIGDTEIVRRLYFAVRTGSWDTASPTFTKYAVTSGPDSFSVELEAECERDAVGGFTTDAHYRWSGKIVGKPDGTITFFASGEPSQRFSSNRIGLCVLYGTPDVVGRPYTITGVDGTTRSASFPKVVNAPLMFEPTYSQLSYTTANGMTVTANLVGSPGTAFSMEDQRNFGDTSFKAYAPLPYRYTDTHKNERYEETITLTVSGAKPTTAKPASSSVVTFGGDTSFETPVIADDSTSPGDGFYGVNHGRAKLLTLEKIVFANGPHVHLFDDDTAWENISGVVEQADSVRSYAPGKPIEIAQVKLGTGNPRPAPDPRNASAFGAAWVSSFVAQAARAHVAKVSFATGPGHAARVLRALTPLSGQPLRPARVVGKDDPLSPALDAFQIGDRFVIVNRSDIRQEVRIDGLPGTKLTQTEFDGTTPPGENPKTVAVRGNPKSITRVMNPYQILWLAPAK